MSEVNFVDTHAHIVLDDFRDDFDEMIARCRERRVNRIMIITLHEEETIAALKLKEKDPSMFQVACGIFPEDLDDITEEKWNTFVSYAKLDAVDAIGEIGLEYHWIKEEEKREKQKEYFIRQIELAKELGKPILVHSRDAAQETFDILKEHRTHGLLHCFSGTKEMAKEYTKLGYYIALGGAVTFKNSRHAKEVASTIDPRFLLSETDCPYMAPEPVRGTRNEPSNIPYIVKVLAECQNKTVEETAMLIDANYTRFLEGK